MSAELYEKIYNEVSPHLKEEDAEYLADTLAFMHPDRVKALFSLIDNYEPSEADQGLVPIPAGYREG